MDHQGSHHDNCASLTPEEVYLRTTPDARLTVHLVLVLVEAALGHQHAPAKRTFSTSRLTKHHQGREVEVLNVLQDLQKPGLKEHWGQWQRPFELLPSQRTSRRQLSKSLLH